ncbi:hypothetical protein ACFORO_18655 [Amycolatopsis halotolerans]|uniref:Phenolic acid decarboxylase n=1 Tax=Amycolatopsis halotolerans TaxID=330083 RepID=A0ABV7QJZ8_9PSEU
MAQVHYCKAWGGERRTMTQPFTERTVKRRYENNGRWFSAVIGEVSDPDCVLEINPQAPYPITVKFFDGHGSTRLSYGFWRMEPDTLFLRHVVRWEYPDDGKFHAMNEAVFIEDVFWEKPDGVVRRVFRQGNSVSSEDYRDVPIDANWEPYPVFGDFASIAREDRDHPPRQS